MVIAFEASDRFLAAAEEFGDARLLDAEDALETKAEQALLEIEHLVSGAHEVDFEVDGQTVRHEPSDELSAYLEQQADSYDLDAATVLELHVDLFARVFLDEAERPPNAPPRD